MCQPVTQGGRWYILDRFALTLARARSGAAGQLTFQNRWQLRAYAQVVSGFLAAAPLALVMGFRRRSDAG